MKNFARYVLIPAVLAVGAHAAPFLAVSDDAEVFLTGTVGVRYDSNIFLDSNAQSDMIWDIDPGVQLVFGNKSAAKGAFSVSDDITRYSDNNKALDSNLANASFVVGYDDGKSKANLNASYQELNQNTVDARSVGSLIRRNVTNVGGSGEVSATEKSSIGGGVQYEKTEYKRTGFSNQETVTIPVNYYFEISPKLDASAGYRFRSTTESGAADAYDHFYNVGLRGEITPKLNGTINVGITERQFHGAFADAHKLGSNSLLGIDSNLSYAVTPKATLQFGVTNDFDTNAQGQENKNFSVNLGGAFNVADELTFTASAAYRAIQYYGSSVAAENRTDHYWEGQLGATYRISTNLNVTAAVSARDNESDLTGVGFKGTVWSLAANLRY